MLYVLLSAAVLLFAFQRCSDDTPTEPPPTTNDTTSHEFVWEVDTLNTHGVFDGFRIWGSDSENVFVTGDALSHEEVIWHWNGSEWAIPRTGVWFYNNSFTAIDGLDKSYAILVGGGGGGFMEILQLKDNTWTKLPPPAENLRKLSSVDVVARDEFYLGGVDGVWHYKSGEWKWLLDTTDSYFDATYRFDCRGLLTRNGELIYLLTQKLYPNWDSYYYLWEHRGESFAVIDSFQQRNYFTLEPKIGHMFWKSGEDGFSAGAGGIFHLDDDKWRRIHHRAAFAGTGTMNNMFAGPRDTLFHFNGNSWEDITPAILRNAGRFLINGIYSVDRVIFVTTHFNGHSLVLRGYQASLSN